jgi:hypothetical protein
MAAKREQRDRNLRLLVSASERKMVGQLAFTWGLSVSDVVRQLIRKAYEENQRQILPPDGQRPGKEKEQSR